MWKYWDKVANSTKISKEGERAIIKEVKERVTDKTRLSEEIKAAIDKYKLQLHPGFLEGDNMRAYLTDISASNSISFRNCAARRTTVRRAAFRALKIRKHNILCVCRQFSTSAKTIDIMPKNCFKKI